MLLHANNKGQMYFCTPGYGADRNKTYTVTSGTSPPYRSSITAATVECWHASPAIDLQFPSDSKRRSLLCPRGQSAGLRIALPCHWGSKDKVDGQLKQTKLLRASLSAIPSPLLAAHSAVARHTQAKEAPSDLSLPIATCVHQVLFQSILGFFGTGCAAIAKLFRFLTNRTGLFTHSLVEKYHAKPY